MSVICLAETAGNPHHFEMPCNSCHQTVDPIDNSVGPLNADINQTCSQPACHLVDSSLSHPVGVTAFGNMPEGMPVDDMGRMTCITCHDDLNGSDISSAFLRADSAQELCISCHENTGGNQKERSHWKFTTKAHLKKTDGMNTTKDDFANISGIDIETYTCLTCHDNKTVTIPGENETPDEKVLRWRDMSDHPIGMDYSRKAMRKSFYYNDAITLDGSIRFFDGRMGCGSCHNLYNDNKNNLAVPTNINGGNGQLCRQCHIR